MKKEKKFFSDTIRCQANEAQWADHVKSHVLAVRFCHKANQAGKKCKGVDHAGIEDDA
jgi:hypothetical protein